ncbi:serine protease inhibitor [Kitasatospora sp. NPDC101183]|uniref:serine protease inhibitor n=1 Tax=Kitasatospora sp. NPDC101183 TaxID=3364100 RepID=UPI003807593E
MTDDEIDPFSPELLRSWPHLVGVDADEAKAVIEAENPDLSVQLLPPGYDIPCDLRLDRVWLRHDADTRLVTRVPWVG